MKKLDKLILKSFIGPLILTFCVSVFILLLQYMLKYFDDLVGKDLGYDVFAELLLYFSINMTPIALPLAILIASIMTYGNLGEHFELTAIKGSGISLTRTLLPTGVLVFIISIAAFFSNNYIVPNANLRAYSLLWDIKHKKPSLDLKEGQFYEGIPNYSIKVRKKYSDGVSMRDIIIYDHKGTTRGGNKKVIIADSCRMYTIINDRYLMMELFDGNHYIEGENKKNRDDEVETFARSKFSSMKLVFSLASFDLDRTDKELFAGNKLMKDIAKLSKDEDSMKNTMYTTKYQIFRNVDASFRYHLNDQITIPQQLVDAYEVLREKQRVQDSIKMALGDSGINPEEYNAENTQPAAPIVKEQKKATPVSSAKADSIAAPEEKKITAPGTISSLVEKEKMGLEQLKALKNSKETEKLTTTQPASKQISSPSTIAKKKKTTSQPKKTPIPESLSTVKPEEEKATIITNDSLLAVARHKFDSVYTTIDKRKRSMSQATSTARAIKTNIGSKLSRLATLKRESNQHQLERYKKVSQALACFIMFLIGAPLGAIIKKGGLGMPVVVSVFFFIIFYVLTVIADKWAKASVMEGAYAAWVADLALLPFGILFLYQARRDAKLFDPDFYNVWFQDLAAWWQRKRGLKPPKENN